MRINYARSAPSLDDDDRPSWNRDRVQTMTSGRFEADFPSMALCSIDSYSAAFRVDAEGYAPAISRFFRENEGEVNSRFKLRKSAPGSKRTVRLPEGTPAAGAEVLLLLDGKPIPAIRNGQVTATWNGDRTKDGHRWKLRISDSRSVPQILVLSDQGVARRRADHLASHAALTLTPWGRIHGQLRIRREARRRGIDWSVRCSSPVISKRYREIEFTSRAETDADGQFSLHHVAPGARIRVLSSLVRRRHRNALAAASRSKLLPAPRPR